MSTGRLQVWGFIFLISAVVSYFKTQQEQLEVLVEMGSTADEITNNSGYLFLSCLPLLVLYRAKPLLQFATLAFVMAFIVMGMKRGAIIIGVVAFVYFIFQTIKNSKGKYRFLFIVLSVALCVGAVSFFIYQMDNSDYMMKRIEDTREGNSSHRDDLYMHFWDYFRYTATTLHFLIGRGANGTLEIYYNYAHNDWLELAVNQGLLGVAIYLLYWRCLYRTWKRATNRDARTILFITFWIFFPKTLCSMSYGDMTYINTSVLGFALANVNSFNPKKI